MSCPVPAAVAEWSRDGIPVKYHYALVNIAKNEGLADSITFEGLQRTTAEGYAYRARGHKTEVKIQCQKATESQISARR